MSLSVSSSLSNETEDIHLDSSASSSETEDVSYWDVQDVDVSLINPTYKLVALTFDDAPSSKLERLVSVFASFNENNPDCPASATLFCNGIHVRNTTLHTLSSACSLGWELGNHGYSHADLTTLSTADIQAEIQSTNEVLNAVDGQDLHLFRPPFGKLPQSVKQCLDTPIIYWSVDTLDWTGVSASTIENTVLENVQEGAIVLLHDGYENTIQAVKRLLPLFKQRGYQAVTLSQMAKLHKCRLQNGGAYIRIRKPKAL